MIDIGTAWWFQTCVFIFHNIWDVILQGLDRAGTSALRVPSVP
jgi:hypothetical protein